LKTQKTTKLLEQAIQYQQSGDITRAIKRYRDYVQHDPENAGVLHALGGLYYQIKEPKTAGKFLEQAHRAAPDNPDYLNDLGAFHLMSGDYSAAILHLSELLRRAPDYPHGYYNLGLALHGAGRMAEAIDAFEHAIRLQPDHAPALYNLGAIYQELGHFRQALDACRRAVRAEPNLVQAQIKLGEILSEQDQNEAAVQSFSKAHALDSSNISTVTRLANALEKSGCTDEGIQLLQNMLQKHPTSVPMMNTLGRLLHDNGQIQAAEDMFRKALSLGQGNSESCYGLSRVRKFTTEDDDIIHRMESLLKRNNLADTDVRNISFALGKIYDDRGEYDMAFRHYQRANATREKNQDYDRRAHEQFVDDSIAVFTRDFFTDFAHLGADQERPIYIVGMPRSGTTLTEQIITSHPQAAGAGELLYFSSICRNLHYLLGVQEPYPFCCRDLTGEKAAEIARHYLDLLDRHSGTARFITDKMPSNYQRLGLIRLLFPRAPIIYCRRDPLDVCLSIFFQNFNQDHTYAFDLMDIGRHYLQYAKLMAHWRKALPGPFMEIQYEDLIAHQEQRSRDLIAFCGLDWDEACLAFYQQKRDVRTSSNWQVRQPIYGESVHRWRNYEEYLAPLKALFADAKDEL